jgi:hypothetical protein
VSQLSANARPFDFFCAGHSGSAEINGRPTSIVE